MATENGIRRRCAIYTRKSCEDGLELEYNSLDAQYDSALSYVRSQAANGWTPVAKRYDDGGFSGGNMNRPALRELLADIEAGLVDTVVVYKIDRLSRSLGDFTDLSKLFERHGVAFVSVTQQIDTSNAAGRMMLNVLMSFAQFEREMTSDRIRDKIYATRKKGLWSGGTVPLGYRLADRRLVVDELTAPIVRFVYSRFAETGSARQVSCELQRRFGPRQAKRAGSHDESWRMTHVYRLLRNPIYKGVIEHKASGSSFPGLHEPLVDASLWEDCRRILDESAGRQPSAHRETAAVLKGLVRCGHCGSAMAPVFTVKRKGVRYSYYRCVASTKHGETDCPLRSVSGELLERQVIAQTGLVLKTPEFIGLVAEKTGFGESEVKASLSDIPAFFDGLFPPERERLLHCLIEEIVIRADGLDIEFKTSGMKELVKGMTHGADQAA